MLPSKKELLDKRKSIFEEGKLLPEGEQIIGYEAYVACACIEPLRKKLTETGMLSLYEEIEIPTMVALHDMEVSGPESIKGIWGSADRAY